MELILMLKDTKIMFMEIIPLQKAITIILREIILQPEGTVIN